MMGRLPRSIIHCARSEVHADSYAALFFCGKDKEHATALLQRVQPCVTRRPGFRCAGVCQAQIGNLLKMDQKFLQNYQCCQARTGHLLA